MTKTQKSIEKKTNEFMALMEQYGFTATGETTSLGSEIYAREWERMTEVVWYGRQLIQYRIEAYISTGYPLIRIYQGGRQIDIRDYSSPKRAINAMKEIVKNAGFEF